ncbi:MAG: hypothetical protein O2960_14290 [Verrucomicrobia bacterium]|nr:hypothetical protein [Verrucomicrobiota bacterium]
MKFKKSKKFFALIVFCSSLACFAIVSFTKNPLSEIEKYGEKTRLSYKLPAVAVWLKNKGWQWASSEVSRIYHLFSPVVRLDLNGKSVTDNHLGHLKNLPHLRDLRLYSTQITDEGLAHLEGLLQLRDLRLNHTQVTDAGLVHLKGLTKLELLSLYGTQITDTGLVHVEGLTNLSVLFLGNTQVTDEGRQALLRAIPSLQVY